jgi:hypothetical protein
MTLEPEKAELKDFESFKAAFADALTPEHIRTIKYGAQEYLTRIEKDIATSNHAVPASRTFTATENLMFLYTTAAACSTILFTITDLANEHGLDL